MDTAHLVSFLQAAERKNMSHAAEDLFMSPQALSKQISALEKELGFSLIVRGNRGIELTEAGEVFAGYASQIVNLAPKPKVEQGRITAGLELSTLTLGVYQNASLRFLPAAVQLFAKLHPSIKVSYVDVPSFESIIPSLIERRFKATMTVGNSRASKEGVTYLTIGHQHAVLTVAKDDPLSGLNSITLEQLRGKTLVVMARGNMHWSDQLCKYIKAHEPDIRIMESNANESGGMLLWQPDVVGIAIPLITPPHWTSRVLVPFTPPEGIPAEISIDLAVHDPEDPSVRAFTEVARIICRRHFSD